MASEILIEAPMGDRARIIAETKAAYADAFNALPNEFGLVPMKFVDDEAPFLKDQVAGFPIDVALLFFAHQKAAPVDENGDWLALKAVKPRSEASPASHAVQIPSEWSAEHPLQRIRLANELQGTTDVALDIEAADEIIREELQRRGVNTGESTDGRESDEVRDTRRGRRKVA